MHTLARVIELEGVMREALLPLVSSGGPSAPKDLSDKIRELAFDLAPHLYPVSEPDAPKRLMALAQDFPELMSREPRLEAALIDYDLYPRSPSALLHANVVQLLREIGEREVARLSHLSRLPGDCRLLYTMMRERYVRDGYADQGCIELGSALIQLFGRLDWKREDAARASLALLIAEGIVEQRASRGEYYRLSCTERAELINTYRLEATWPHDSSGRIQEIEAVQRAVLERTNTHA